MAVNGIKIRRTMTRLRSDVTIYRFWNMVPARLARQADRPAPRVAGLHEHEAVEIRAQVPVVDRPSVEEAARVLAIRRVDRGELRCGGEHGRIGRGPVRQVECAPWASFESQPFGYFEACAESEAAIAAIAAGPAPALAVVYREPVRLVRGLLNRTKAAFFVSATLAAPAVRPSPNDFPRALGIAPGMRAPARLNFAGWAELEPRCCIARSFVTDFSVYF